MTTTRSTCGWKLRKTFKRRAAPALFLGLVLAGGISATQAEFVVSLFSGVSTAEDNDLRLKQAGGTALTFHDVSYETKDFESPLYYGGRVAYFLPQPSSLGFGLEFFHAKMYLNTADTVHVTGSRAGAPVNASERVGDSIESFSLSHGLNFLLADVMYRWFLGHRGDDFLGRFQPYVGGGIGVAIPHVESTFAGVHFEEYQVHGPAYQVFAGVNFDLTKHLSVFGEYKFTYVELDRLAIPGRSIGLTPMTHHFVAGISFRF